MPRGGPRPNSGRSRKWFLAHEKLDPAVLPRRSLRAPNDEAYQAFKTALDWCMATLNDPSVPTDLKARIAAVVLPFQMPKIESVAGPTKKEQAEAAAEAASSGIYAPPPAPKLKPN